VPSAPQENEMVGIETPPNQGIGKKMDLMGMLSSAVKEGLNTQDLNVPSKPKKKKEKKKK
jgi:hypothetical protein